jgi:Gram-negative bacterial TonB protein C-terminal
MADERCNHQCQSSSQAVGLVGSRLLMVILGVALLILTQPIEAWCQKRRAPDRSRQKAQTPPTSAFGADGKIECVGVVRGLPYGLTDQAIAASRAIRFEPAMIDGKPAPVQGNLEFTFNLD